MSAVVHIQIRKCYSIQVLGQWLQNKGYPRGSIFELRTNDRTQNLMLMGLLLGVQILISFKILLVNFKNSLIQHLSVVPNRWCNLDFKNFRSAADLGTKSGDDTDSNSVKQENDSSSEAAFAEPPPSRSDAH